MILQPAEWSKPRGFSHGVAVDGPGRWIVLAGQTGGDEKGEYQSDMAGQVGVALQADHQAAGGGRGRPRAHRPPDLVSDQPQRIRGRGRRHWRGLAETLGRNFPPSTLLYIAGLVDVRAKVEIEVTAFVPARIDAGNRSARAVRAH